MTLDRRAAKRRLAMTDKEESSFLPVGITYPELEWGLA
jgi:hypothetical protein